MRPPRRDAGVLDETGRTVVTAPTRRGIECELNTPKDDAGRLESARSPTA
jgi:hypothetical protein